MTHFRILPLVLAAGALGLAGCFPEEESKLYTGETVVEFGPQQSRGTTYTFTIDGSGNNYLWRRQISNPTLTAPTVRDSVEVQVVTTDVARSQPIQVNFAIQPPATPDTLTAVQGTTYRLVTQSPVTIPAGSFSAKIYFDVLRQPNVPIGLSGDSIRFILNEGTGYKAAPNNRRFRVAVRCITRVVSGVTSCNPSA